MRLITTILLVISLSILSACDKTGTEKKVQVDEKKVQVDSRMVMVNEGCFIMGEELKDISPNDKPHEVCVDSFYIDKYEVTQMKYTNIMGENKSSYKGNSLPVQAVLWDKADKYCKEVGKRLPTEAEWEYAARSGEKKEKWSGTNKQSEVKEYAWYSENSDKKPHPVGKKKPNGLGLYDMSGNVQEWVADWYGDDYYKNSPKHNPAGPESHIFSNRVLRGGTWWNKKEDVRTDKRSKHHFQVFTTSIGFRCAKNAG